jgi:hypothetical protein
MLRADVCSVDYPVLKDFILLPAPARCNVGVAEGIALVLRGKAEQLNARAECAFVDLDVGVPLDLLSLNLYSQLAELSVVSFELCVLCRCKVTFAEFCPLQYQASLCC